MKRLALAALLVLAAPLARAEDASLAPLLDRIATVEAATHDVYDTWDYRMSVHAEELDKAGKPTSDEVIDLHHLPNGDEELVRDVKDGKDVTAEHKKKMADEKAKATPTPTSTATATAKKDDDDGNAGLTSPFERDEQKNYTFTRAEGAVDAGCVRIRFEPKDKGRKGAVVGDAVVEEATGHVRTMSMRPAKLPHFVTKLDVAVELQTKLAPGPVMSTMTMSGEGGLLFIKKRFRATTTFSDWKAPAPAPAAAAK